MTKKTLIGIRMTEQEKAILEAAAKAEGRSVTSYAVKAIMAYIEADSKKAEIYDKLQNTLMDAMKAVTEGKGKALSDMIISD